MRKRVGKELQIFEDHYRGLFETTQDGILLLNGRTGWITSINPFLVNMLGYSRDELLGKKLWEIGAFQDTETIRSVFSELQRTGFIFFEDLLLTTHDGWNINTEFVGNVYHVNDERVIQCSIRNISERKHMEEILKDSERRYRELADSLPQTVVECDEKGFITFVNHNAFETFGYAEDDLEKGINIFQIVVPEDHERVRANIEKVFRGEKQHGNEYKVVRKDGSIFPVVVYTTPVTREKKPAGLRLIAIDLTERKKAEEELRESEERFQTIFNESPFSVVLNELERGAYVAVNRHFCDVNGVSEDFVIGKTSHDLQIFQNPDDVKRVGDMLRRYGQIEAEEISLRRLTGELITALFSSKIITIAKKPHALSIIQDITNRKLH
jgi:PAS domain S-box-containing protein